ncbi:sigma-70 family RNA polymerase sigma factor [bacterium]|nr:sigma-70 family RNA polymerase sigma factor [bacterium]
MLEPTVSEPPCATERDQGWIDQFHAGDSSAFDALINHYGPWVARIIRRLGIPASDVPDLTQETFADVLNGLPSFRGDASFKTWLARITIRRVRKHRRWRWVRRLWLGTLSVEPAQTADGVVDSESLLLERERAALLRDAVARLPDMYREVIVLRYFEEIDVAEMAKMLHISRATADMRLSRGREMLRKYLALENE